MFWCAIFQTLTAVLLKVLLECYGVSTSEQLRTFRESSCLILHSKPLKMKALHSSKTSIRVNISEYPDPHMRLPLVLSRLMTPLLLLGSSWPQWVKMLKNGENTQSGSERRHTVKTLLYCTSEDWGYLRRNPRKATPQPKFRLAVFIMNSTLFIKVESVFVTVERWTVIPVQILSVY
jgi:hypothetical protein